MGTAETIAQSRQCPACGGKGKTVKAVTIASLVVADVRAGLSEQHGFRFCPSPGCDVAYFNSTTGEKIAKAHVNVRLGQKEISAPRMVCYCFHHTVEEIEGEILRTGKSTVLDDITEKCRQGLDRCVETNPQGACCLGNVRRALKEAQAKAGTVASANLAPAREAEKVEDCCANPAVSANEQQPRNTGIWATGGAVVAAILSSACCWLPLALIALGASAAGVAGFFETYRPYLLGATGLLLATSFYFVFFRKPHCESGSGCAAPQPKLQRFNQTMLGIATVVAIAFAAFPNYLGVLLGNGDAVAAPAGSGAITSPERGGTPPSARILQLDIGGMTCAGCATGLSSHLNGFPGVRRATVSYESKSARVELSPDGTAEAVLKAISDHGFRGTIRR